MALYGVIVDYNIDRSHAFRDALSVMKNDLKVARFGYSIELQNGDKFIFTREGHRDSTFRGMRMDHIFECWETFRVGVLERYRSDATSS